MRTSIFFLTDVTRWAEYSLFLVSWVYLKMRKQIFDPKRNKELSIEIFQEGKSHFFLFLFFFLRITPKKLQNFSGVPKEMESLFCLQSSEDLFKDCPEEADMARQAFSEWTVYVMYVVLDTRERCICRFRQGVIHNIK